jgi:hypothetical protein
MGEKTAAVPAWAEKVIRDRGNEASVVAILEPKMDMLTHKTSTRPDACGDIPQGLQYIAAQAPSVFAQEPVVKLLARLLRFVPAQTAPRDGLFQVHPHPSPAASEKAPISTLRLYNSGS